MKKNVLIVIISIIIIGLISLLIYANFSSVEKEEKKENNLAIEHSFEDLTIKNLSIKKHDEQFVVTYEIINGNQEDYKNLNFTIYLVDKNDNLVFSIPSYVNVLNKNETKKNNYYVSTDISDAYDYRFEKSAPIGL